MADRLSPAPETVAGVFLLASGLIGASMACNMNLVYLLYGLGLSVGVGLMYVPALSCVPPWFVRQRARAIGLAVSGTGVGTLCLPLATSELVNRVGWRDAMRYLAALVIFIGLPAAALLDSSPEKRGLLADGDLFPQNGHAPTTDSVSLRLSARHRTFWLLYAAVFLGSLGIFIAFVHIVPFAVDLGIASRKASILIGLIGAGNIFGRFVQASVGDRIGRWNALSGLTGGMGIALLLRPSATGFWTLGAFAMTFGAFAGGCIALYPAVAADAFGTRWSRAILGVLYTAVGIAAVAGPLLAAVAFDRTGSYTASILISAICAGIAAILTWTGRSKNIVH
jgi:MFS family permease